MKKDNTGMYILIGVISLVIIIFVIAIIQYNKEQKELSGYKTAEIYNDGNEIGELIDTDVNLFNEIKNSDKVSIIYIGRPTCPACVNFYPVIVEVSSEYNLDVYYTDTDKWTSTEVNRILSKSLNKFEGTPTTLIMYKGKEISSNVGYVSKNDLIEFFKEYNLIREEQ